MNQRVPDLTEADLTRVVERDFSDPQAANARLTTEGVGLSVGARVSVIKLSSGSLDQLRELLGAACTDERDVIAWAEYPRYMALEPSSSGVARKEAVASDWQEFQLWLGASRSLPAD